MARVVRPLAAVALASVVLAGCTPANEARAASLADRIAIAMADDIAPAHSPEPLSGEHLAWAAIEAPRLPDEVAVEYAIDAYDWSGDSGGSGGATFSVRIDVHVLPYSYGGFNGSREEAFATRCWTFVVRAIPEWQGAVDRRGTECPDGALPDPQPDDLLEMPDDAEDRISAVLAVATPDDVEALLREEFPGEGFTITVRALEGEIVVSVFVAREPSCRVGVRTADGEITVFGVPPSDLLPGEGNCDVRYLSP